MKALIFHCKEYKIQIEKLANRPKDVEPEEITERKQESRNCIAAFITVEKKDDIETVSSEISKEIIKTCKEVGRDEVVIVPFAHLSNNLAKSKDAKQAIDLIEEHLKDKKVIRTHFGSHKSLLLNVYGHVGAVRFREF